jgi:ubiquitin carboxyl-terminal hydrolase 4/11
MVTLRSEPADAPHQSDSVSSNAPGTDSPAPNSRSSSPAKRRADEMDDQNIPDLHAAHDKMDLDLSDSQHTTSKIRTMPDPRSRQDGGSGVSSGTPVSPQVSSTPAADDSSATTQIDDEQPSPSLDEQVEMVISETLKDADEEGYPGYIVSKVWLGRVISRTKFKDEMGPFDKSALEGDIGSVDNSDIILDGKLLTQLDSCLVIDCFLEQQALGLKDEMGQPFIPLKKGLQIEQDLQILPQAAWDLIMRWYGLKPGQQPIIRYRHQTNPQDSPHPDWQYELFPPMFTLRKYQHKPPDEGTDVAVSLRMAPRVVTTRSQKYMDFIKVVKHLLEIPLETKINILRVIEIQAAEDHPAISKTASSMLSPPTTRENSPAISHIPMIMTMDEFKKLYEKSQIDQVDCKDQSMNASYNGKITLDTLGLRVDESLVIQESSGKAKVQPSKSQEKAGSKSLAVKEIASEPSSGRASPASGMMTRGRYRTQSRPKGTVGLTNLGNTCYMNSALQCMRACQELTLYFSGE